jgi:insertion element IS1 protein InsB
MIGKSNTRISERKYLTLSTPIEPLAGKTICFSFVCLHDVVVGLFINRYEFGRTI